MDNNVIELPRSNDFVVQGDEVRHVTIAAPKLARMESECRLLAVLLESGVESWDGYPLALDLYRQDAEEDTDDEGTGIV